MFDTQVPIYGIIILLALISNIIIVLINSKRYSYNLDEAVCLLVYENIGIICGAKIFSFLQRYKELNGEFDFFSLGLSSFGAVIGALIFLLLFSLQFKRSFKELLFIFIPPVPLMYAIGKLGCFFSGCCYGIEYNGVFNVIYKYSDVAPKNISLFPVQFVETIIFLLIFIYSIIGYMKNKFNEKFLGITFILCGIAKFGLDFLRMSHKNIILSVNQIVSIIFILIGIVIYLFYSDKSCIAKKYRR